MERNLVPDLWTADGEGALPELGPCPHDNSWNIKIISIRWWRGLVVISEDIVRGRSQDVKTGRRGRGSGEQRPPAGSRGGAPVGDLGEKPPQKLKSFQNSLS